MKNLDNIVTLRNEDLEELVNTFCFPWTTPEATKSKWENYIAEQKSGKRTVCLVKADNRIVGYGSLLRHSEYPEFLEANIPEIHDVWVSKECRGQGLGKKIIIHLEKIAQNEGHPVIGLGVGLYKDYGRAQRLYIKLGYVPDGNGITYQYKSTTPGNN